MADREKKEGKMNMQKFKYPENKKSLGLSFGKK